ncbi:uncharacterized protein LOC107819815 [Nicotiana tabacum]|uniref:uncharacterized protein LOC107819815 n=1 Tax=Nicotiana tabacum TaxID=4097 RepID=UPI003F4EC796
MVGFVREQRISRILIDDGSGVNILPIRTIKELDIPMDELCESRLMIQGFNQGGQRAIGAIKLEINMGDLHSSAWMHVIDAKTSYNILLGRPWIYENKVVSSTYHQCLKYCEDGVEKKIVADDKPFIEAESYFADAKFYLKNYVSKEVKVDEVILTKIVAKKVEVTTSKENITVDQVLHYRNKMNKASSSKKVAHLLRYVPKTRKIEDPSSELQGKVIGDLTLSIKRIDAIKSSTKLLKGFVKSSSHNSLLNLVLHAKRTDKGFDPNAYKLLSKARYDPNEPSKLGKLPPEASKPTQKMMMEKGYPLKQSREGLGYKQPPPIRISIKRASYNYITTKEVSMTLNKKPSVFDRLTKTRTSVFDRLGPLKKENKRHGSDRRIGAPIFAKKEILTTQCPTEEKCLDIHVCRHISFNDGDPQEDENVKDAQPELEEGVKTTVDALKEVNLGVVEDPKPTYISVSLTNDEEGKYIELLKELKDVFAWSYKEMPGLDPKVVVHHLVVRRGARHVKQAQRRFRPELVPLIETEVNKLIEASFGEFPLHIPELMINATTGYEAMSFMDGSSGYNQIRMALKDEELTAFRTPKGIYCYKIMPFGLKNVVATYQRAMQNIFDDMLHKNAECYINDLVVKSRKKDDHLQDLRMVFERLRRYQLRMNPLKCAFGVTSRKFLGFIV